MKNRFCCDMETAQQISCAMSEIGCLIQCLVKMRIKTLASLVLITLSTGYSHGAKPWTYSEAVAATLVLNDDPGYQEDWFVECFIKTYEPVLFEQFRNDEFEFPALKEQARRELKKMMDSFDLEQIYYLSGPEIVLHLHDYDFDTESFPIELATHRQGHFYFTVNRNPEVEDLCSFTEVVLRLKPNDLFVDDVNAAQSTAIFRDRVEMPTEKARTYIQRRKDNNGEIDRKVPVTLLFNVVESQFRGNTLLVDMTGVIVYADDDQSHVIKIIGDAGDEDAAYENTQIHVQ